MTPDEPSPGTEEGSTTGRVVVVTAAGQGIGQAVALAFAARGDRIVVVDLDAEAAAETLAAVHALDRAGVRLTADVTSPEDAARVSAEARRIYGRIDVLVNVVGGSRPGQDVTQVSPADWDAMLRLNLTSVFAMCRAIVPVMEQQGDGCVVNVSSGAGLRGMRKNPAYCAAKAGVVGLTRALAIDHAPHGVRVNCVAPGPVLTPLMRNNRSADEIAAMGTLSLVGRIADPRELADAIVFLASPASSYVVGQTLSVDGGVASAI